MSSAAAASSSSSVKTTVCQTDKFFEEGKKLTAIVKHGILIKYLQGWSAKLSQNHYNFGKYKYARMVYVDGFAGPRIHLKENEFGSPTLVYECLLKHKNLYRNNLKSPPKIYLIFIEKKKQHCADLLEQLQKLKEIHKESKNAHMINFMVINDEFARALEWVISAQFMFSEDVFQKIQKVPSQTFHCPTLKFRDQCFITRHTPLFVFADPFGYSGKVMPMTLFKMTLQSTRKAEFYINIVTGFLVRFLETDLHEAAINLLFGSDDWKTKTDILLTTDPPEKKDRILKFYYQQLQGVEQTKTTRIEMRDERNRVVYHLMYVTRNKNGFVLMKQAMSNASHDKEFYTFSAKNDKDVEFGDVDMENLANGLIKYAKKHYPDQLIKGEWISKWIDEDDCLYQRFKIQLKEKFHQYCVSDPKVEKFDERFYDFEISSDEKAETSETLSKCRKQKLIPPFKYKRERDTTKTPSRSSQRKKVLKLKAN